MNKIYFLNLESRSIFKSYVRYESGFKAPSDVANIIKSIPGVIYKPIIRHTSNRFWGSIELAIQFFLFSACTPKNSVVFMQYPIVNIRVFNILAYFIGKFNTITIIHDLQSYRYPEDYSYRKNEIKVLNKMSCLIVHTDAMKNELIKEGVCSKIVVLGVFDYLLPTGNMACKRKNAIVFAGGLNKSLFLKDFKDIQLSPYILYAYGAVKPSFDLYNIDYKGSFLPDDVSKVEGEWGLVWDGDSIDSCTGNFGEYLKFIAPHKLSLYIACGLKIIVWEKSAMAQFVQKHNIGITIESLSQIKSKIDGLSDVQIKTMSENLANLTKKVREGKMLEGAFKDAISLITK